MEYVRFLSKAVIVLSKKKRFDYKNNHECDKSANFELNNICKIN